MKYLEIYLNERLKELEKERKEYVEKIKKDIETRTDEEIVDHIVTDYTIFLETNYDKLEEIKKIKEDIFGEIKIEEK